MNLTYYKSAFGTLAAKSSALPFTEVTVNEARESPSLTVLFERAAALSRASFAPNDLRQIFSDKEDIRFLDPSRLPSPDLSEQDSALLTELIEKEAIRAVNLSHPRFNELLAKPEPKSKLRVNILAIGDVGSTLLTGLKLLGKDTISSIGICDISEKITARWEFEMNQVALPWDYDALPEIEIIPAERLFDGDVFVFVASKGIPPVGSAVKDVRMAQLEANSEIVATYAKMARNANFKGLFAVVSDPVDPLAKTAFLESNKDGSGSLDFKGLLPEQVAGFGLGVMNARAAYFAKKDPRFKSFLTEGRSFGPHGADLVIANSIENYDDALSKELTGLTVTANLKMRELGFKPYVAPALSSGAISLTLALGGNWHCGSAFLGGVFMGAKKRYTSLGMQHEVLSMPDGLFSRIEYAANRLAEIV